MAEIIANEGGDKKGKRRPKKGVAHVDMTPMVDLFMLLLTFFMMTTAFSKPKAMELILPDKDKNVNPPKIDDSRTVNIILDENNKVYYYFGMANQEKHPELVESSFGKDGIRKMLLDRNKEVFAKYAQLEKDVLTGKLRISNDSVAALKKIIRKEDINGPVVLIKASESVKYVNMVDVIDEMSITNISSYAIVDMSPYEKKMLAAKKSGVTNSNP
jgi:biopolymer transport protein ExbD